MADSNSRTEFHIHEAENLLRPLHRSDKLDAEARTALGYALT